VTRLLALSFDTPASPSITLKAGASSPEHPLLAGWGMVWYPPGDRGAMIVKDPGSVADFAMARLLKSWSRFRSTTFLCQLYGAAERRRHEDTQPFARIFGDRQLALSHNGYLTKSFARELPLGDDPAFEPLGHTDSEHLLCWLLNRLRSIGVRRVPDLGWETFHGWLREVNRLGTMNLLLTDGDFLVVYQDSTGHNRLHVAQRTPPHQSVRLEDDEVLIDLGDPLDQNRSVLLVSTRPFTAETWRGLDDGEMLVVRRGEVVWRAAGAPEPASVSRPRRRSSEEAAAGAREYGVRHVTTYRYETPVEVSQHVLRLRPVSDRAQEVLDFRLDVEPAGIMREFEDVFGNDGVRLDLDVPFTVMRIESRSTVRVREPGQRLGEARRRSTIPMSWMPWQREMMAAYLLPPELPAPQLQELDDYAMSFAERQDLDLLETLDDINRTLHRDWAYVAGSTTVETTPWEVFVTRRGVCQDFANLFICLARLLGIPARYRVGYLFTGDPGGDGDDGANDADHDRRRQSQASHAWAELYLPHAGWRGFDPTNGCLAGRHHVRVACGRNFRDATPTAGTIYRGGGRETLEIEVQVERASTQAENAVASRG
jgi:transglutaminase-like putative cysteine protease/predicted glutamine amidotransferase